MAAKKSPTARENNSRKKSYSSVTGIGQEPVCKVLKNTKASFRSTEVPVKDVNSAKDKSRQRTDVPVKGFSVGNKLKKK
mgnify:CR=1